MENKKMTMLSRDGKQKGTVLNLHSRRCTMEGCGGWRIHVRWPDGKNTYPCSRGCKAIDKDTLQII